MWIVGCQPDRVTLSAFPPLEHTDTYSQMTLYRCWVHVVSSSLPLDKWFLFQVFLPFSLRRSPRSTVTTLWNDAQWMPTDWEPFSMGFVDCRLLVEHVQFSWRLNESLAVVHCDLRLDPIQCALPSDPRTHQPTVHVHRFYVCFLIGQLVLVAVPLG